MFYAYVVRSVNHPYLYKGHCEDLKKRLLEHNSGMTKSIRMYAPFELVYFEEFATRNQAVRRERYFKTAAGRRFLKEKIGIVP
jgi:putative endonuclease